MTRFTFITTILTIIFFLNTISAQTFVTPGKPKPCTQIEQMPKDKMNDPLLIKHIKSILKSSENSAWQGEILKVVIIDNNWFMERDKFTGAVLARYIRAEVAVRRNGNCWLYHLVTFKQNFNGSKFENMIWDGTGDTIKIPCDKIN